MAALSLNISRAAHENYGGRKAFDVVLMMQAGSGYGAWSSRTDGSHHEWMTWRDFPDECVEGCKSLLRRLGVPATAIRVS